MGEEQHEHVVAEPHAVRHTVLHMLPVVEMPLEELHVLPVVEMLLVDLEDHPAVVESAGSPRLHKDQEGSQVKKHFQILDPIGESVRDALPVLEASGHLDQRPMHEWQGVRRVHPKTHQFCKSSSG